ncbi:MAG TPA: hypothetical protein VG328_21950 [Stellaceae bacterium]|nr:hypothetical protein [Stellaceae bacterium]
MAYTTPASPRAVPAAIAAPDVSAVSWAAVFAGALGAVAITVILVELGIGLGFASISPWTNSGASLATLGVMGGVWLVLAQWISAAVGGYLAGRLRTKWTSVHTDEVFFRDTAHGFLAWALGTVIGVLLIAAGGATAINASSRVAGGAAAGAGQGAAVAGMTNQGLNNQGGQNSILNDGYYIDMLYRPAAANVGATNATAPNAPQSGSDDRAIARRILIRDLPKGALTPDDRTYLAQSVAAHDGISQSEAEQRVDQTMTQIKAAEDQARQATDTARKTAAFGSIATALAMVIGAFIASVSAVLGGKLRDAY